MEQEVILLDTSVLIDYFRKKDKDKSYLFKISGVNKRFVVSTITQFEIYTGAPKDQIKIWDDFFRTVTILPLISEIALIAAQVNIELRKTNKQIDLADLFIAATAIYNDFPCATLNKKHFERINDLQLVD